MARYRPDAFTKGRRTRKAPVRGNISPACIQIQLILARYACHASKRPRRAPLGNTPREHLAAKGRFRRPKPSDHAGARILPPSDGLAPAQGLLPEQLHRGIAFQRLGPCPGGAHPGASPIPTTCQCLPLAVPIAARDKPPMGFGAIIRLMACSPAKPRGAADRIISTGGPISECCAELGLDSRTVSKWAQNLRRMPQARPVLRQRCRKRPSKGRVPLGGTIGTPQAKLIEQLQQGLSLLYDRIEPLTSMA